MSIKEKWLKLHAEAGRGAPCQQIRASRVPESDWAGYSPQKVTDFLDSVLATFTLLDDGEPFSTLETGVFAGGTSAVFLHALGLRFKGRAIHVGIDPYFVPEQSFPQYAQDYGREPYLVALKKLSEIAVGVDIPYVPYLMSSATFIRKDLMPVGHDFRVVHLDGDHSAEAVFMELDYFSSKLRKPGVFILDDIGETFPGVREGIDRFQEAHPGLTELGEFVYDTRSGRIGFAVFYLATQE